MSAYSNVDTDGISRKFSTNYTASEKGKFWDEFEDEIKRVREGDNGSVIPKIPGNTGFQGVEKSGYSRHEAA
ncbi:MAG: hypothetical protein HQL48_08670 [Gammaproteobacteria bacterium]|nr:hypothetical protein [Gammaproteobacteria bacterium]